MKKIFLSAVAICLFSIAQAQVNAIDEMFNKYGEKKGFTTVVISSKLLSLFTPKDEKASEGGDIVRRLKSIRILSVEDSLLNQSVNFYKELSSRMNLSAYEELMTVREGDDVTKFLIKQKGDIISELLVITGGPNDNTLISIQGDLDLKMISNLSKDTGIEELKELEKVDQNQRKE
ncbi:MAG: DUF4252 domain-containing protein [Bacteroidota bacterium]|nr:DUF4252 domain-containing protein [Bacteroidota bacterium]